MKVAVEPFVSFGRSSPSCPCLPSGLTPASLRRPSATLAPLVPLSSARVSFLLFGLVASRLSRCGWASDSITLIDGLLPAYGVLPLLLLRENFFFPLFFLFSLSPTSLA